MTIERTACEFEMKFADGGTQGSFEGYASVFGVQDSYGDVIVPGAFKDTLALRAARGGVNVPMYLQHGAALGADALPAGVWTHIAEDSTGLAVKGQLLGLDTEKGRYHYALAKGGALRGLSIGFRAKKADYGKKAGDPRRTLKAIDLFEISLVADPANGAALVTDVKAIDDEMLIERVVEDALRCAGYSRKDSETIVARFKSKFRGDPGAEIAAARLIHSIKGATRV